MPSTDNKSVAVSESTSPYEASADVERDLPNEEVPGTTTGDYGDRLTDSEGEDEFITKFGAIQFQYIKRPKESVWFTRPHALNYFKDGVLYRTKGERTSAKTELFLDLLYVGIIANLAGDASTNASASAFLRYVLLFIPAWTVWADIKDFTNYYYNEDLSQRVYIFWILALLALFVNSQTAVLESVHGAAYTIVPYMLCRFSLAVSLIIYSFYIPEHRPQMRLYASTIFVTCCIWISVIFVGTRAKIGISFAIIALEQLSFVMCYHPFMKRLLKVKASTALNIEHEVERFATFVTIAVGEFLYKVVATNPLGVGLSAKFARGVFLLLIAYSLFWIYQSGSTSRKSVHALRNSGATAIGWIYAHLPLVGALVLAADAGGDIMAMDNVKLAKSTSSSHEGELIGRMLSVVREAVETTEHEEEPLYALSFYFTGGICVCLICMFLIASFEKDLDPPGMYILTKWWRIMWRVPIGIVILCLSFAELDSTLLFGLVALLLSILLIYESVTSTPKVCLPGSSDGRVQLD